MRVGLIEDSPLAAKIVRAAVERADDLAVTKWETTVDGALLSMARSPDVWLVDLLLPGRSGLSAIAALKGVAPVVVLSDAKEGSALASEALARGAVGFVSKRSLATDKGVTRLHAAIRDAVSAVPTRSEQVVAVVGSTGAVGLLQPLLRECVDEAAFVVLIHLPPSRCEAFSDWVNSLGVPARVAVHGDTVERGVVLVAPADHHLELSPRRRCRLSRDPAVDGHRPAATRLLRSGASLGSSFFAVVLSGLGRDGAAAVPDIIRAGGTCIVQDPSDARASSMPTAAVRASVDVQVARTTDLGRVLVENLRRGR